ncbi:MAG: hypothetical protein F4W90_02160 [Gammaproteobacteria bacterium]|nr:hypothetical protein [Gammaproteobacteria bacterium]
MPLEYYVNIQDDSVFLQPEFEEMVLHELGHAMDYGTPDWFQADLWQTAVDADNAFVTEYAKTNTGEDFAESFVAWVIYRAYRERVDPSVLKSIERIAHRLQYFDDRLNNPLATCKSIKPYESLFQC